MIRCPNCKSENVLPIMYGYPTYEAFQRAERGEILLGGCEVTFDQPDYGCVDCKYRWSKRTLPFTAIKKVRFKVWENGLGILEDMKTWIYEIHRDGSAVKYTYFGKSRRYSERVAEHMTEHEVYGLLKKLQEYISVNPEDHIMCQVCDGCSFQLQVSYIDGRKEVINGDMGGGTLDTLMMEVLEKVFHESELR